MCVITCVLYTCNVFIHLFVYGDRPSRASRSVVVCLTFAFSLSIDCIRCIIMFYRVFPQQLPLVA